MGNLAEGLSAINDYRSEYFLEIDIEAGNIIFSLNLDDSLDL